MLFGSLSIPQVALVATFIYVLGWIIYCRYFHPLHSVPGPFLASVSRAWIVFKTMKGDMEHTQRALHKKHGRLVRIAPNEVACSDPEAIKVIATAAPEALSDFYRSFTVPRQSLRRYQSVYYFCKGYPGHFSSRDEKEHSERRRIINNIYSMASVLGSEQTIDTCTQIFCENMYDFAKQRSKVDLGLWINRYAFDIIGEIFHGKKFGFMSERTDVGGYMEAVNSLFLTLTIGGTVPSYLTNLYFISTMLFSSSARGAFGALGHIEVGARAAVRSRKEDIEENRDNKRDMLRKMLEINADRGEKINFTNDHICVEALGALFAGADTTAIAINSVLYHLMRNPATYEKLTAEVDAAVADRTLSMPVTYAEAVKLPYLKACINESMRLHPSVALTMPRLVPASGATISGFQFPKGYRVGINPAVVHYDKDVFGPDADGFNPDRWINGDAVQMEKAMIQFGAGPHVCLGKNISLSEIYKLVPHIVRLFHIRLANPSKEWKTTNFWFNKQSDINVYVEERAHSSG